MRRKSAGFRTNILIAAGSCIFTLAALGFGTGDPTRVPGQIVTGIGFLGAGAILHSSERVHGMTTAAMIWVNAALGTASPKSQRALIQKQLQKTFANSSMRSVCVALPPPSAPARPNSAL